MELCRWAKDLCAESLIEGARAVELRVESRVSRGSRLRYFYIRGFIGDTEVTAAYTPDGLTASPLLLDHARVIVGMGDTFPDPSGSLEVVPATLAGPAMTVLLTLVRACRAQVIEIGPLRSAEDWGLR